MPPNVVELFNKFVRQFKELIYLRHLDITCKMTTVVTPITDIIIKAIS